MNKTEVLDQLKNEKSERNSLNDDFNEGRAGGIGYAINLVNKLEEQKPNGRVKIPPEVATIIKMSRESECDHHVGDTYDTLRNDTSSKEWTTEHPKKAMQALVNGYEIDNDKYIIKLNNMYFLGFGEDGTSPTFAIDNQPGVREGARCFSSRVEAKRVATLFEGEVETL